MFYVLVSALADDLFSLGTLELAAKLHYLGVVVVEFAAFRLDIVIYRAFIVRCRFSSPFFETRVVSLSLIGYSLYWVLKGRVLVSGLHRAIDLRHGDA